MSSTGGGVPVRARCHPSKLRPHKKARTMSNHPARTKPKPAVFNADSLLDEIAEEALPFEFKGEDYTCPAPSGWPDEVFEAIKADDPPTVARLILGEDYERFRAAGGSAQLFQRIVAKLHGVGMGESSGSSSSSDSTASPSKPISSASTVSTSSSSEPVASLGDGSPT
jgi:hypothetical protein